MSQHNQTIGALGESLASSYLHDHGYQVIKRHATSHWGEIDIIAEKDATLCFVEVKTKTSDKYGKPYEAVTRGKLIRLKRSIEFYLQTRKSPHTRFQIHVISILLKPDLSILDLKHFTDLGL